MPPILGTAIAGGFAFDSVICARDQRLGHWHLALITLWLVVIIVEIAGPLSGFNFQMSRNTRDLNDELIRPLCFLLGGVGALFAYRIPPLSVAIFASVVALAINFALWSAGTRS